MRRNTPLFVLVLSVFVAVTGLVLWANLDCTPGGALCYHPGGDLGAFLAVAGGFGVLLAIVLEVFVGLRQTPSHDLPVPPACRACGHVLIFFHDYGLWYCPACYQYSAPKTIAPMDDVPRGP